MYTSVILFALSMTGSRAAAQAPQLSEIGTFGCAMCAGTAEFAGIRAIALGPDGRVIVADRADPQIRIFGPDGSPVRAFGRSGEGPGELELVVGLGLDRAGIVTLDMRLLRVTGYDSLGSVIKTRRIERFPLAARWHAAADALIVPFADWSAGTVGIARVSADTTEVVVEPPVAFLVSVAGATSFTFAAAAAPDGGFALGDGAREYRIRRYDRQGRPVMDYARSVPRVPRTAAEVEELRARLARGPGSAPDHPEGGGAPAAVDPLRNHFGMGALVFDDAGRLWVRTDRGDPGVTVFDVFGADGRFLGERKVDGEIGEFAFRGSMMAGVVRDELDVERVRLWRVAPTAGRR